jgi:hypothetical protein
MTTLPPRANLIPDKGHFPALAELPSIRFLGIVSLADASIIDFRRDSGEEDHLASGIDNRHIPSIKKSPRRLNRSFLRSRFDSLKHRPTQGQELSEYARLARRFHTFQSCIFPKSKRRTAEDKA